VTAISATAAAADDFIPTCASVGEGWTTLVSVQEMTVPVDGVKTLTLV